MPSGGSRALGLEGRAARPDRGPAAPAGYSVDWKRERFTLDRPEQSGGGAFVGAWHEQGLDLSGANL